MILGYGHDNKSVSIARSALALLFIVTYWAIPATASPAEFEGTAFADYKADTANGEYMFNAAGCAACHASPGDSGLLSGGLEMRSAIGTFRAPNISAHSNGIGGWSNSDFLNAVMIGVKPDGTGLYPVMPYTAYAGMKPEDVLDIKAYIETLPQSDAKSGDHEISFPFNQQFAVSLWKRANFATRPFQPTEQSQLERGRYLVENVAGCAQCHTGRTITFGLDAEKPYAGEKGLTGDYAPAIDQARLASLPSPETFVEGVLVNGTKLNGSPIAANSMKKISQGTAKLSEEDRLAIYAFLANKEIKPEPQIAAASCSADAAVPTVSGAADLTAAADEYVGKYCRSCHGPGESAQGSFPAGDMASIAANPAFVTPGDAARSRLYTSISSGRMPLGKRPTASETEQLAAWITSLTAAKPTTAAAPVAPARQRPIVSYTSEVEAAVRDITAVHELDRQHVRYFSYRSQYNAVMGCETDDEFAKRMKYYQAGFRKLLNSLSYGPTLVIPTPVSNTRGTLVRVDLRDLKWTAADWDRMIAHYFYGISEKDNPSLETLVRGTGTVLPVIRTDWFMSNASKPPLYNEFLRLPDNILTLEKDVLRVDLAANIRNLDVVRAGFGQGASGVSDHNRMLERHDLRQGGYYWVSYDFAGDVNRQNLKRFPHGPENIGQLPAELTPFEHDGGEMIFSLPNGMQGYYLSTNKGDRLNVGPTAIVSFRSRPIGKGIEVTNGRSCFDCHADGIIPKRDEIRSHIETSTLFSLDQRDVLLKMYLPQDQLDKVYQKDLAQFVAALDRIGAAEKSENGTLRSLAVPGKAAGTELITYYADLYEENMDLAAVAAEFDFTPQQFEDASKRLRADTVAIALDWITRLKAGVDIPRHEVEREFAKMVEPMTGRRPLNNTATAASAEKPTTPAKPAAAEQPAEAQVTTVAATQDFADDRVKLAIKVASSYVKVGDKLKFSISTNKDCELQVLYVESDGNVEVFPQSFVGDAVLRAGEQRTIPPAAVGDVVFDAAAPNETLIAFCKAGGLGNDRITADAAKKLAQNASQPLTRGITFKLAEKGKTNAGKSAVQVVAFEVQK